jgi:predicted RNase H-like nuclease (RuvC/YqgF family)
MNSTELETQIKELEIRIQDTENSLKTSADVDEGLTLQREMDSLQAYRTRLEKLLEESLANEIIAKKEQELADLDTFLTDSFAKAGELKSQISNLIRRGDLGLEALYEAVKPIRNELWTLSAHYERSYRLRNGYSDWIPDEKRIVTNPLVFMPILMLEVQTAYVTVLALDVLHNEKTQTGLTLKYIALAAQNLKLDFNLP